MASSSTGKFRPWVHIGTFVGLVVLLYGLILLPGSKSPKLGIDLQGGTRITLTAQLEGGATPSRESMQQARAVMEGRVNGSGVVGAQVQVDGARQLVVTVPGTKDLGDLARSAKMNIRPVFGGGTAPAVMGVAPPVDPSTSPSASESASPGTTAPATTRSAIGETLSNPPTLIPDPGAATVSGEATASSTATDIAGSTSAGSSSAGSSSADSSSATSTESGQPLRAGAAMTTATGSESTGSAISSSATTGSVTTGSASSGSESTGSVSSGSASSGSSSSGSVSTDSVSGSGSAAATVSATAPGTASIAMGTVDASGKPDEALLARFPAGSNPLNPTQPAGNDDAAFTAWETAALTAMAGLTCQDLSHWQGLDDPNKPLIACDETGTAIYLLEKTLIPGSEITNASAALSSQGSGWAVNVTFGQTGFNTWFQYTGANVGALTAFTLDGTVLSAPSIRQAINTTVTEVSGSFTQQSATDLANALKFGALPLQFSLDRTDTVSQEVGAEALRAGLIAGGIGLLLVVLYCLFYYRLLGLITILSLVLSGILVYAVMVLLGRWIDLSLDMAGIAGLIIAIGITADSFVIYFERLKDEVREGRTFRSAVPRGWARAKTTILSADAVTLMSAVILYVLAVGDVKGFAFTLGLSTVLDLVVVYLVTHPLVSLAADSKAFRSPRLSGLGAVAEAGARQRTAASKLATKEA